MVNNQNILISLLAILILYNTHTLYFISKNECLEKSVKYEKECKIRDNKECEEKCKAKILELKNAVTEYISTITQPPTQQKSERQLASQYYYTTPSRTVRAQETIKSYPNDYYSPSFHSPLSGQTTGISSLVFNDPNKLRM